MAPKTSPMAFGSFSACVLPMAGYFDQGVRKTTMVRVIWFELLVGDLEPGIGQTTFRWSPTYVSGFPGRLVIDIV